MFSRQRRQARQQQQAEELAASERRQLVSLLNQAGTGEAALMETNLTPLTTHQQELLSTEEVRHWNQLLKQRSFLLAYPETLEKIQARLQSCKKNKGKLSRFEHEDELSSLRRLYAVYSAIDDTLVQTRLAADIGITAEEVHTQLVAATQAHYERLYSQRHEAESFSQLHRLIGRTRPLSSCGGYDFADLAKHDVNELPMPEDWNYWVARHYTTPYISMFHGLPSRGRGAGDVRLLAAEALRCDDFVKAQMALAYCNSDKHFREEVGDVLTAELAKLVDRYRAQFTAEAETAGSIIE